MLNLNDIPYFYEWYETYKENNPLDTHEEINTALKQEMVRFYSNISNPDGYIADYAGLTQPEKDLYNQDPVRGVLALNCALDAQSSTEVIYASSYRHNNNGDAYRHAYWSALMVIKIGSTWAQRWNFAHEDGYPNQPEMERNMDIYNNMKGREIAENEGLYATETEIQRAVENAVKAGNTFVRIVNNTIVYTNAETGR